jgi:uncharacterized membrane protein
MTTSVAVLVSPWRHLVHFLCGQSAGWSAVAAIAFVGLLLRLPGSSGDLWLDEIWSLDLVEKITSIDQIFWRINHDNNHFLNSAYLYLVGPHASPLVHRALSIGLGVATVFATAAVTADRGRGTQLIASLLFAISYPMVHYGSEARGYSGLVLFTLLSILCLQRRLDGRGSAITLGVAITLGLLSHLTMFFTIVVLVAWTAWRLLRNGDGPLRAALATGTIFRPALIAALPFAFSVIYGARVLGFTMGGSTTSTLTDFAAGYGGMIRFLFGLPSWAPDWPLIVTACGLVCLSAWSWQDRRAKPLCHRHHRHAAADDTTAPAQSRVPALLPG